MRIMLGTDSCFSMHRWTSQRRSTMSALMTTRARTLKGTGARLQVHSIVLRAVRPGPGS